MKKLIVGLVFTGVLSAQAAELCKHHEVIAEFVGEQSGMDVYCHPSEGYAVGQHCFGLVKEGR